MQCDIGPCDISPCDLILGGEVSGLTIYRCANWTLGATHGGGIGDTRIFDGPNQIFGRLSREDNQNGAVYYYKTFWENIGSNSWPPLQVEVTSLSSAQFSRESVAVAIGTLTDDMTNKPNDSAFVTLASLNAETAQNESIPIWIRQTVTAGGTDASRAQDVQFQIMLVPTE